MARRSDSCVNLSLVSGSAIATGCFLSNGRSFSLVYLCNSYSCIPYVILHYVAIDVLLLVVLAVVFMISCQLLDGEFTAACDGVTAIMALSDSFRIAWEQTCVVLCL